MFRADAGEPEIRGFLLIAFDTSWQEAGKRQSLACPQLPVPPGPDVLALIHRPVAPSLQRGGGLRDLQVRHLRDTRFGRLGQGQLLMWNSSRFRTWLNRDDGRFCQVGNQSVGPSMIVGVLAMVASIILWKLHSHVGIDKVWSLAAGLIAMAAYSLEACSKGGARRSRVVDDSSGHGFARHAHSDGVEPE
jgi:hypothetical protein